MITSEMGHSIDSSGSFMNVGDTGDGVDDDDVDDDDDDEGDGNDHDGDEDVDGDDSLSESCMYVSSCCADASSLAAT